QGGVQVDQEGREQQRGEDQGFGSHGWDLRELVGAGGLGVAGVKDGREAAGGDVVHVGGGAHLRREQGGGEQAPRGGRDGGVRVSDGGGFERLLGAAGRLGGLVPEAGVGEKAGSALGVMDNRDFEEIVRDLVAEQLLGEEGEVFDVVDDGLGDAPPRVADDRSVAALESDGECPL